MNVLIAVAQDAVSRPDVDDALRCAQGIEKALRSRAVPAEIFLITPFDLEAPKERLLEAIRQKQADIVFNLFEGFASDPAAEVVFAQILEKGKVLFTGNGSRALQDCLDKSVCRSILQYQGVQIPQGVFLHSSLPRSIVKDVPLPCFVKPCCEDASVGIDARSLCLDRKALQESLDHKLDAHVQGLIVEEFIPGREFNAAFLGAGTYRMLAASVFEGENNGSSFLSYGSKWDQDLPSYKMAVPRDLAASDPVAEQIRVIGGQVGRALGCRGYFRIDLREKDGELFVIDVNPNPDINEDAGFVRQASKAGLSYGDLLVQILEEVGHVR